MSSRDKEPSEFYGSCLWGLSNTKSSDLNRQDVVGLLKVDTQLIGPMQEEMKAPHKKAELGRY